MSVEQRLEALHAKIANLENRINKVANGTTSVSVPEQIVSTSTSVVKATSTPAVVKEKVATKPKVTKVESSVGVPADRPVYNHEEFHPQTAPCGDVSENEIRVRKIANETGVHSSLFHRAPSSYYSWRLEQRREFLNAPTVHHLCKSIVMNNSKCPHENFTDKKDSKYYMIIVQYTARLHNEKLGSTIRFLHDVPPSRKLFNFRLVSPEKNDELTGYSHNGVSPLGCRERLPVIISDRIAKLNPPFIWLGAGEVDLKWRVSMDDLYKYFDPIVADITYDEVNEDPEPTH